MQQYFREMTEFVQGSLRGDEQFTCNFAGEDSDFVRFNRAKVRQAGSVLQLYLEIDLISGRRHARGRLTLSGQADADRPRVGQMIAGLREQVAVVPEDPHLNFATEVRSSEQTKAAELPDGAAAIADIQAAVQGLDLVGVYAAGGIHAGFASSTGQRNWYTGHSFNFDWSLYHEKDKAVKLGYAGFTWDAAELLARTERGREQLAVMRHPARTIAPGRYRVYLAPEALGDIISTLGWGGFGLRAHRTRETPLLKLASGEAELNAAVAIAENTADGIAPSFQSQGFLRPERVALVDGGRLAGHLVSPRSAREFDVATNGADDEESPQSVDVAAGSLRRDAVLAELGTGLLINNLHYLNYSDRSACRTTGMTRFATFWVEGGEVAAPVNVMRFDETVYRMLGENLIGLTREREMLLDPDTYGCRKTVSTRVPGALVDDFTLTL